ncbi:MAG TPA: hypothetical protein VMQ86_17300 [Bryobacteraceae bacterium]|jgi:hypothetical protein|nr:hypothetical protein [Bryobacteraceae bacterium]
MEDGGGGRLSQRNMRQEASFFEGKDPVLVYIARRLKEALRLEATFSTAGVDYGVEADEYRGGFIFQRVRTGAFFYVLPDTAEAARSVLRENGYRPAEPEPG